jgi:hypothetical protein
VRVLGGEANTRIGPIDLNKHPKKCTLLESVSIP